jgi:hypothetical protein
MTPTPAAKPAHANPKPAAPTSSAPPHGKPGSSGGANAPGLMSDNSDGMTQAKALGPIGIPIYYPKLIQASSHYCSSAADVCPVFQVPIAGSYPRAYLLHDRQGIAHYAYRMTLVMNPALGQYYGVQGTTWQNPPILNSPSSTKMVNGKQLLLFTNGSKVTTVAWKTPRAVYWISNTLTDDLTNQQMVAIAASLTRAGGR